MRTAALLAALLVSLAAGASSVRDPLAECPCSREHIAVVGRVEALEGPRLHVRVLAVAVGLDFTPMRPAPAEGAQIDLPRRPGDHVGALVALAGDPLRTTRTSDGDAFTCPNIAPELRLDPTQFATWTVNPECETALGQQGYHADLAAAEESGCSSTPPVAAALGALLLRMRRRGRPARRTRNAGVAQASAP